MQHNHLKKQHLDCQRLPSHTCDAGWRMWMELIQQIRLLSRFEAYDYHLGNTFCLEGETMMEHNFELHAVVTDSHHREPSASKHRVSGETRTMMPPRLHDSPRHDQSCFGTDRPIALCCKGVPLLSLHDMNPSYDKYMPNPNNTPNEQKKVLTFLFLHRTLGSRL